MNTHLYQHNQDPLRSTRRVVGMLWLLTLLSLFALLMPAPASAAIRYVKWNATGWDNGTSWTNAFTTLNLAIGNAVNGDEIWVAAGTYTPIAPFFPDPSDRTTSFSLRTGIALYGGFAGTEISRDQRNWTSNVTILSGDIAGTPGDNSDNSYHVVSINSYISGVVLDGFTITGGNANGPTYGTDEGGGMWNNDNSSFTIANCVFSNNSALFEGGGIYTYRSSFTITNSTVTGNHVTGGGGGGGMANYNSTTTMINCTVTGNSAGSGGGMFNSSGSLTITNSTVTNNSASFYGGGMWNQSVSPTITNVIFHGNTAAGGSGAIENYMNAFPIITNTTFFGNTAPSGQAIHNRNASASTIINSIVWETVVNADTATATFKYCDFNGTLGSGGNLNGGGNINADPLFKDPASDDFRLQAASPCLDVGKNLTGSAAIYADIRGSLRPINAIPGTGDSITNNNFDMGAYEYSALFSGIDEDSVVKPFRDVKLNSSVVIPGYPYDITWKNKTPFPDDLRITQAGFYSVNILLQDASGVQRKLNTTPVEVDANNQPIDGYKWSFTFDAGQVGVWKVRIELASDQRAFALGNVVIKSLTDETWPIGAAITPPSDADPTAKAPTWEGDQNLFYWDPTLTTLYALRPARTIVTWYDAALQPVPAVGVSVWPTTPQTHIANAAAVGVLPVGSPYTTVELKYTENSATLQDLDQFRAPGDGYSVLMFQSQGSAPHFVVVRTRVWHDPAILFADQPATIGQALSAPVEHNAACGGGFVLHARAPYAARTTTGEAPADGYDRATRQGPLVPVNQDLTPGAADNPANNMDDLAVAWYQQDAPTQICWPDKTVRYTPQWPTVAPALAGTIVIARGDGSGDILNTKTSVTIYNQPDKTQAGYNPNEEHALLLGNTVHALRTDLNLLLGQSEPYAIVKYLENGAWQFTVWHLVAEQPPNSFNYPKTAGELVEPPYPLNTLLPVCPNSTVTPALTEQLSPWWEDSQGQIYAKKAGSGTARYFYPLRSDFFYDLNLDGVADKTAGQCIPWFDRLVGGTPGTPRDVAYTVTWPASAPVLFVSDTLITPKDNLPDIRNQCSVQVIYDQPYHEGGATNNDLRSVKLLKVLTPYLVDLDAPVADGGLGYTGFQLPAGLRTTPIGNNTVRFPDLPPDVITRLTYNEASRMLSFAGYYGKPNYYDPGSGAPEVLLPNIMSATERETIIKKLLTENPGVSSSDPNYANFQTAIGALFTKTRANLTAGEPEVVGATTFKVLSAADTTGGIGYVTLAFNDKQPECAGNPVSLAVIQVSRATLLAGSVGVFEPENVFDERVAFRHSGDFAGQTQNVTFEWRYTTSLASDVCDPDSAPYPPALTCTPASWGTLGGAAPGLNLYTIGGAGLPVLQDKWLTVRYKGYARGGSVDEWSAWTPPQIYMNWVKRVVKRMNPFEQRFFDFHKNAVATYVSMLQQAGRRYEGPVALNADPAYLNSIGLIELYSTVVRRARELSIDAVPAIDDANANLAILFGASRVADLYMLLGNEAYADAADPSIGFTSQSIIGPGIAGSAATTLFAFQDQTPSLLTEELELLRGRDSSRTPAVTTAPAYNRLRWNFTSGKGQVAYVNNYNVETEVQAKTLFPHGHGDAWGHYLTAIKTYYNLLRHPAFTWLPCPENLLVAGEPVLADFGDEREFVAAAAAKARTGAEIVNLTYRQAYLDKPEAQWQGYKDSNAQRAWGLAEWAARSGQGAYFDWVTANALLPVDDSGSTHPVDRQNIMDVHEIASQFTEIQQQVARADIGLNPLGVAKDAIPFDIDPVLVDSGQTHFEQIYARALQALHNARLVFDYANQYSQMLRKQQETTETFQQNTAKQERDYANRLIEIFGYPYSDDIGAGKTYPAGYDGPDLYHYDYVDVSQLLNTTPPSTEAITVTIKEAVVNTDGTVSYPERAVPYHIGRGAGLGLIKPATWTGTRRAPGEIQQARSGLLLARERLKVAIGNYEALLAKIEGRAALLQAQYNLNSQKIQIKNTAMGIKIGLNAMIVAAYICKETAAVAAEKAKEVADASAEALPKSVGTAVDATSVPRSIIKTAGAIGAAVFRTFAAYQESVKSTMELSKDVVEMEADIQLETAEQAFAVKEKLAELKEIVCDESTLRADIFMKQEEVTQAIGRYATVLAKGVRLLDERTAFRQKVADDVREARYADMAFRIFRSEALQKYRAQFDLAAMYVYLVAKAYDYDTGLLSTMNTAGEKFLTDIVKARVIGEIRDGTPVTGSGLANQMAQMAQNFAVLKGQMGFNNPQIEDNRFSLREEHFRRLPKKEPVIDVTSEAGWKQVLHSAYKANLWDVPEFRQLCRAFSARTQVEPALVIPFRTTITSRLNFFGWPLSGGDSYYDASRFATKIRRVGVWFKDYDTATMAYTPRVYLVPAGDDRIRVPFSNNINTRSFSVVDQIIPLPFPLDATQMEDPAWSPMTAMADSGQDFLAIRRYSRMRAYPYTGNTGWENELQWDSRLIGRSVWNGNWLLIIPGSSLSSDAEAGLDAFINSVTDILFTFQTYSYEGYGKAAKTAQFPDMIPE